MSITHVRASLGDKLIANADRYYTASIPQMIDELVQNARRAGATAISAELTTTHLVLSDNGRGLPRKQAPVLIRLGGSNNDATIETAENAAGIGFFSLAHCDVRVTSRDWTMEIPREAFIGKTDAILSDAPAPITGMRIEIAGLESRAEYKALAKGTILLDACRYSGVRLTLAGFGDADGVHEPCEFLKAPTYGEFQTYERRIHGLKIQLVRGPQDDKKPMLINFFGKVIAPESNGLPKFVTEEIGVLREKTERSSASATRMVVRTKVKIDVLDTSVLRLQLPERNALIEDDGFRRVVAAIEDLYLDFLISLEGPNGIPWDAKIRSHAKDRIAPPTICIREGCYDHGGYATGVGISTPEGLRHIDGRLIAQSDLIAVHHTKMLSGYLLSPLAETIVKPLDIVACDDIIHAYGDTSPAIVKGYGLTVKFGGDEHHVELEEVSAEETHSALMEEEIELGDQLIDDASLTIHAQARSITVPIGAIIAAEHGCESDAYVAPVNGTPCHEVVHLMLESLDWEDESCDDYKEDRRRAGREYQSRIANILGSNQELFRQRLIERLDDLSWDHLRSLAEGETVATSFVITRNANGFDIELAA